MDLEPEMGAAAAEAAVYDTPPLHLRQIPSPTPSETATDNGGSVQLSPTALAQMVEMFGQVMSGEMDSKMKANLKENAKEIKESMNARMEANTSRMEQTMREEMQCMGAGLQGGLEQVKKGNGELLRATCWATEERRLVEVTEEVTVTETCTREIKHIEMTRIG